MGLSRILLAWLAVTGWLLLWEAIAGQTGRRAGGPRVRRPYWRYAGEAALLTLFGALWFGSLGTGAWWLVFGLVGAIAQWPAQEAGGKRRASTGALAVGRALRVGRIVAAGGLLAWRLAPA